MSARFWFSYVSSCHLCLLLVLSLIHLCVCNQNIDDVLCLESERQALLQFKHGLVDEANRLASWGGKEIDCCKWAGIACDNSTGHVRQIHLPALDGNCGYYVQPFGLIYEETKEFEDAIKQRLGGSLSPSLLHLKQLRHLDLSCNDFGDIQVPNFIGSLKNLEYLNLSYSNFGGIIPPQFGNLSQLHVLSLGDYPNGSGSTSMTNMHWLSSLRMLHHLDMSNVDLSKETNWLQVINTLPSLAQLHLSNCQLLHIHPQVSSFNLTSLSLLDLSGNNFNTSVPPWMFDISSLVSLDLSGCNFHGPIPSSIYSFRNLTSLQLLHVSENDFMNSSLVLNGLSSIGGHLSLLDMKSCSISSSVLESLHNLTSLQSLDLSENQLTNIIPKSLGNFCNLRDMDLSDNDLGNTDFTNLLESFDKCKSPSLESLQLRFSGLSGRLPDQLGQLIHLEHLELEYNHIAGTIPDSIGMLSSMKTLDLSGNLIFGPIPFSIGRLSLLENLDFSYNQLNGSIPDSIGRLSSLIKLDLSNNQLDGNIPDSIGQLSLLMELDLSYNQLNDSLPNSLGQLSKLKELKFFNNLLTGDVTEAHFAKLSSLKSLNDKRFSSKDLKEGNNLTLRLQLANWIPPFQIEWLILEDWCLGPRFPFWLGSQKKLQNLDMSNTGISHMPPESFWRSFPNLIYLDMSKNHIQGPLLSIPAGLYTLDLSSNKFRGNLPDLSNISLPIQLDLSNNSFTGSLHHVLCPHDVQWTKSLNLGYNSFSGVIPECWEKFSERLYFLNLENNNLSGGIPRTLGSSYTLRALNLRGNKLSGSFPVSLMNLTGLEILQLGGNELVGSIPAWFGRNLSLLRLLNLRSNHFDGNIPPELCYQKLIQILDLANNNLSGNIPRCFNNFSVLSGVENTSTETFNYRAVDISENVIISDSLVAKGQIHAYDSILHLVMLMDLSNNRFSGNIPVELTTLQKLQSLNLSRNQLTGSIPEKIGNINALESFDVSLNKLSGELPVSLSSIEFLSSFNVSYNNLTGTIPSSTQFHSFDESSFLGNLLCGDPLPSCAVEVPDTVDQNEDDVSHRAEWGLIICIVLGFLAGFWFVVAPLMISNSWRLAYFRFLGKLWYMMSDVMHKYC
uniref:receptor-like protein EIX2 n=1 Tax=Erigeron canadensis TaxID=72917 RepID=UPI001CB8E4B2|nr:receptor-like protein EIX2 [Erigeron canadensis]